MSAGTRTGEGAGGGTASEPDLERCAQVLERARLTGAAVDREAAAELWRANRSRLAQEPGTQHDLLIVAHLEALTALAEVDLGNLPLAEALPVADLLREAGDHAGALLHALACLRRGALAGDAPAAQAHAPSSLEQVDQLLAAAVRTTHGPGLGSVWYAALALVRALGDAHHEQGGSSSELLGEIDSRVEQATREGLAAFTGASPAELDPLEVAALAMLHREEASLSQGQDHVEALRRALALLPAGVRVGERAVLSLALATSLLSLGGLDEALFLSEQATADAREADQVRVVGASLALAAEIRHARGDLPGALADLERAANYLGEAGDVPGASRAYHDLAVLVHRAGRSAAAANLADEALIALEEYLHAQQETFGSRPGRGAMQTAAALAELAAICHRDDGALEEAAPLALHAAAWSRHTGDRTGLVEALVLAGDTLADDVRAVAAYDEALAALQHPEAWVRAAQIRRVRAHRVARAHGGPAAHLALTEARLALDVVRQRLDTVNGADPDEARLAEWEGVALTEDSAEILTELGEAAAALTLAQGLAPAYLRLDDAEAARRSTLTAARALLALDRTREALETLESGAATALAENDEQGALLLGGSMAEILQGLGRHQEAERAWATYYRTPSDE